MALLCKLLGIYQRNFDRRIDRFGAIIKLKLGWLGSPRPEGFLGHDTERNLDRNWFAYDVEL